MATYTKDDLLAMSVHTLRVVLRTDFKGVPGVLNKNELIDKILSIQSGEKPPVRSTKGRKPLDEFLTPADLELRFEDFESDDSEVPTSVCGVLELHAEGYGFIRRGGLKISRSDAFVSKALVKKYSLKCGDLVAGECAQMRDSGVVTLRTITSVNGSSDFDSKRVDIASLRAGYPTQKYDLSADESQPLGLVDKFSPLGKGQRCVVLDQTFHSKATFIQDLATALVKNGAQVDLLSVCEKPEDATDFLQIDGCQVVEITPDSQPQFVVRRVALAVESAKRQLELGKNPVLIISNLNAVISAYGDYLSNEKADKGFIEEGMTARNFAIKCLNCAGNYGDKWHLTVISVLNGYSHREYSEFISVATSVVDIIEGEVKNGYSVNAFNSYTLRDEKLLTEEQLKAAAEYKAKLSQENSEDFW